MGDAEGLLFSLLCWYLLNKISMWSSYKVCPQTQMREAFLHPTILDYQYTYMYGNYPMTPLVQTHPPSLSDQCDLTKPAALPSQPWSSLQHICARLSNSTYILGLLLEAILSPLGIEGHPIKNNSSIYVHPISVKSERGSNSSIPGRRPESPWSGKNSRSSTSCKRSSE